MDHEIFERIIQGFLENKVGVADGFLGEDLSAHLKDNLLALLDEKRLNRAGIGNNSKFNTDVSIRSDLIYWLDKGHNDVHENDFFLLMDKFVDYLNLTCYSGITGYEFHYAYYAEGSSYKRHLDQFKDDKKRAFSMIMYLNVDWIEGDGGQLRIFHENSTQLISPKNGICVFFKSSELEHEVLLNFKPRLSITGWLKTD